MADEGGTASHDAEDGRQDYQMQENEPDAEEHDDEVDQNIFAFVHVLLMRIPCF